MKQMTAVLVMIVALAGCSAPRAAERDPATAEPITVTVAPVAMANVGNAIDAGGVVQAHLTATIAARILAPVREVRALPGDRVRKGQTLIVLDVADLSAAARAADRAATAAEQGGEAATAEVRAAQAGLTLARASHDRVAGLHARGSATAQELDDAVATLRSAEARLAGVEARARQAVSGVEAARAAAELAGTSASFGTLVAPFDGVVTEKLIDPGNTVSPGTGLLRLEDTREFRLEVRVDESRAGQIHNGDRLQVFVGARPSPVDGTVIEVSRAMDADARAFLIKVALPGLPGLRSGEFGKVRLHGSARRALTIPSAAILRRGQLSYVFVADGAIARVRLVSLSDSEVLAGLAETELVIVSPPADLRDGRRILVGGR